MSMYCLYTSYTCIYIIYKYVIAMHCIYLSMNTSQKLKSFRKLKNGKSPPSSGTCHLLVSVVALKRGKQK